MPVTSSDREDGRIDAQEGANDRTDASDRRAGRLDAAEIERAIETVIGERFDELETPGLSVAVVDGSATVLATAFGDRQLDPTAPASADTLWGIGSATKPITATAVMQLVEAGRVDLEDPVASHVPYLADAPGEPITVGELLTHTSGMPADDMATVLLLESAFGDGVDETNAGNDEDRPADGSESRTGGATDDETGSDLDVSLGDWASFREYVAAAADRRIDGEHCLYYNSGYVILGRLVETVTDTPFAEYVRASIFDPLGMDRSTFDTAVLEDEDTDAMTAYYRDEDGFHAATLPDSPLFEPPGGLLAPVTDVARFLSACIEGSLPLDPELAERMREPVGTFRQLVDGRTLGYGHGWMSRPFDDDVLVEHAGGTGVSAGYLGFLEHRGLGVAIGCNAQPSPSPETLAVELLAELTGTDVEDVLPRRAIERTARTVTGEYESYPGIQRATVEWTGDRLEIEHRNPLGGDVVSLAPASLDPDEFVFRTSTGKGYDRTVEFVVDGESGGSRDDGTTDDADDVWFVLDRVRFDRVGPLEDDATDDAETGDVNEPLDATDDAED